MARVPTEHAPTTWINVGAQGPDFVCPTLMAYDVKLVLASFKGFVDPDAVIHSPLFVDPFQLREVKTPIDIGEIR